ncbi:MAG: hypothetical protein Q7K41_05250 [Dehalococcoidales bacterium]|nr:hypothetical protein [Dehalococcoidales bacterium]
MVDDKISSGFAGLGTAGVVVVTAGGVAGATGVDAGGVVAGVAGVVGVETGGVTGVIGGAGGGLVQPASKISAATIIKILLYKASLFDTCFNAIIHSFKFLTK